jgi:ABC-type sugar transport system ATPase subunit
LVRASFACSADVPTSALGLSAAGREAFLDLLAGADRPQSGTIRLGGKDVAEVRKRKGTIVRIGSQGAKPSGRPVAKVIGREDAARAGLDGKMNVLVKDLGLPGRVRLAIAMALLEEPGLILLNAPAQELSGEARRDFTRDLGGMMDGAGCVVVLAAGSADEAGGLGGQVVVLEGGLVVQLGQAVEVMAHPVNLAAALATSWPALNTVGMTVKDGMGRLADGATFQPPEGVVMPVAGMCTLAFRPEDATLERAGANCVRFVVKADGETEAGGRRYLRVAFAGTSWLAPMPAAAAHQGAVVNAFIDRARLMMFDAEGKALA